MDLISQITRIVGLNPARISLGKVNLEDRKGYGMVTLKMRFEGRRWIEMFQPLALVLSELKL
jgi:hypothetical protein